MSIEQMSLVHLVGSVNSLDAALMKCCESELFHLENPTDNPFEGFTPLREENPHTETLQAVTDIMNYLSISPDYRDYHSLAMTEKEITDLLQQLKETIVSSNNRLVHAKDQLLNRQQLLEHLKHLQGMDIKFSDLLSSQNSTVRFGRLPFDSFLKLDYFANQNFFFFDYDHDEQYYWGFYMTPNLFAQETEQIFKSLYFEEIDVAQFVDDTPQTEIEQITAQIAADEQEAADAQKALDELIQKYTESILQIYSKVKMLHDTFAYRTYATASHGRFYLAGFVPTAKIKEFSALFDDLVQVVCEEEPVTQDMGLDPPVKLKTNWFFRPFEMFVNMYGLPDYYAVNPTSFIGFIYMMLFGIMFGDFGQGLLICIGGALIWKWKKMDLAAVMSRCGIASMFFGLLYGSCFGFEGCFKPLFKLLHLDGIFPLDVLEPDTSITLLVISLGIGIVIILAAMGINIFLNLRKGDYGKALFSNNGIAGMVMYGGVIAAVVVMLLLGVNVFNPIFLIVVVALPLVLMFFHKPLGDWLRRKRGKRPLEGEEEFSAVDSSFEMFDVLLSYCTNTLSFLRVGGFVLSHAALMLVVMTFAHMAGTFGSPIVVVLGNAFVMALEGLIVGIQVLRLVYYETFSRFYESNGHPFTPAKVLFQKTEKK